MKSTLASSPSGIAAPRRESPAARPPSAYFCSTCRHCTWFGPCACSAAARARRLARVQTSTTSPS